jgi:hypothetical protein
VVDEHPEPGVPTGPERRDRRRQLVDAVQRLHDHALDAQVVAPDPLDQGRVVHALDPDPAGPRDPRSDPVHGDRPRRRPAPGRRRSARTGRFSQRHRRSIEQERGRREGKVAPFAVPVLEDHRAVLEPDDRPTEARFGVLHHKVRLGVDLRNGAPAPPVVCRQDVHGR